MESTVDLVAAGGRVVIVGLTAKGVHLSLPGLEFTRKEAIAAVILGGASLAGGRGTIWGAMIVVFSMGLMKNVLIISRFSSEWQGIVLGAVLVAAVAIDSIVNRKRVA
jgi:ribose/xylose/arabinose/galactoside ABC-type transport system permease subunit